MMRSQLVKGETGKIVSLAIFEAFQAYLKGDTGSSPRSSTNPCIQLRNDKRSGTGPALVSFVVFLCI